MSLTDTPSQMNTSGDGDRIPVVSVSDLKRSYGEIEAVRGVSFDIYAGDIFGIIGPDGAGKTSIFNIMGGVIEPDGGSIEVLGNRPLDAKNDVGYLTQQFSLYSDLSISENIDYSGALRHVDRDLLVERKRELLSLMDLLQFSNRLAGQLSGGMKQKLALCCALISRPKILLLDEPTTGVDPVSRREFWDILASISAEGVTVAVATPYLDEAERCNRIVMLFEGDVKTFGSPESLKQGLGLQRVEVRLSDAQGSAADSYGTTVIEAPRLGGRRTDSSQGLSPELKSLEVKLQQISDSGDDAVVDVQPFGDRIDILTPHPESAIEKVQSIASRVAADKELRTSILEPTLENVFVHTLSSRKGDVITEPFDFIPDREEDRQVDTAAIKAVNLTKMFGDFAAVNDVSLSVGYGEIFGLLGANGAGKTTTIKMLCGLISGTSGEMSLCGESGNLRSAGLRRKLGYMSQKFTLYDDLTIGENLEFYCGVYGIEPSLRKKRIDWALRSCGLTGQESLITSKLPGGWKQRLAFGACVMHQPKVLFLDEPTSGVDPLARRQLWAMIRDFAQNGAAILVTTHFLEEAEHCHRLAFMVRGEVVAQGSPESIKAEQPGHLLEMRTSNPQKASEILKQHFSGWQVSIFADKIHLTVRSDEEKNNAKRFLTEGGIELRSLRQIPFSLEDSFIGIVERAGEKRAS